MYTRVVYVNTGHLYLDKKTCMQTKETPYVDTKDFSYAIQKFFLSTLFTYEKSFLSTLFTYETSFVSTLFTYEKSFLSSLFICNREVFSVLSTHIWEFFCIHSIYIWEVFFFFFCPLYSHIRSLLYPLCSYAKEKSFLSTLCICNRKVFCVLYCIYCIYCIYFIFIFLDGYCSTVQGLLDWFEVDLVFTELSFIQIDLCVLCVLYCIHCICCIYCMCIYIYIYIFVYKHVSRQKGLVFKQKEICMSTKETFLLYMYIYVGRNDLCIDKRDWIIDKGDLHNDPKGLQTENRDRFVGRKDWYIDERDLFVGRKDLCLDKRDLSVY